MASSQSIPALPEKKADIRNEASENWRKLETVRNLSLQETSSLKILPTRFPIIMQVKLMPALGIRGIVPHQQRRHCGNAFPAGLSLSRA